MSEVITEKLENIFTPPDLTKLLKPKTDTQNATKEEPNEITPTVCGNCNETIDEDEAVIFNGETLCQECADERTFICCECGERHWQDDSYNYNESSVCENCYQNHYTVCENCDRTIRNDEAHYINGDEDYPYCYSCYTQLEKTIRSYDYRPEPKFYTHESNIFPLEDSRLRKGIFYGVELEIDEGGEDSNNAETILNIGNKTNDHIYIKHDGSINNGFEIVSHPMSLGYHTNSMPWRDIFKKAVQMDYLSHKTDTCGFHIHVDRQALGGTSIIQENTIARILFFIEKHWDKLLIFSRRTERQIAHWAARYGLQSNPKETLESAKKSYGGRYVCLNLQNFATIEFRIFRGTLKYQTFIATLQLVDEICKKSMSNARFQAMTWNSFVSGIKSKEKPELINYLRLKNLLEGREDSKCAEYSDI